MSPYDPDLHHRRSIRLRGYDYRREGAYFITICTQGKQCLFGQVVGEQMELNAAGQMIQSVWQALPEHYPGVDVDAFVVMPNHIHGIIILTVGATPRGCPGSAPPPSPLVQATPWDRASAIASDGRQPREIDLTDGDGGGAKPGQPRGVAPTLSLPDVVHRFKSLTTTRYREGVRQHGWRPFPGRLWQRNYYEHIIRSEEALFNIRSYIAVNPERWSWDSENPGRTRSEETMPWTP